MKKIQKQCIENWGWNVNKDLDVIFKGWWILRVDLRTLLRRLSHKKPFIFITFPLTATKISNVLKTVSLPILESICNMLVIMEFGIEKKI